MNIIIQINKPVSYMSNQENKVTIILKQEFHLSYPHAIL
ncbi:hypothetical protein CSC09_1541 [Escherichia coli]|nr:hypothetical protein CSC09_1541 [Escherichia coli]KDA59251.1 hypothetical protein AA98_0785 [Escherichia coli 2-011-08_S1_C1]